MVLGYNVHILPITKSPKRTLARTPKKAHNKHSNIKITISIHFNRVYPNHGFGTIKNYQTERRRTQATI